MAGCSQADPQLLKQQYVERGDRQAAAGEHRAALIDYRKALQIDPHFATAHYRLAEAHIALGDPDSALPAYLQAADRLVTDDDLQLKTGQLLLQRHRFTDAEARARAVLRRQPRHARALVLLAGALAGVSNFDAAFEAQQQALAIDPRQAATYVSLGALQFARGHRDQALAALREAAVIEPESVSIQLALSAFYWAIGAVQEAEHAIERALAIDPHHALANGALARLYMETDRAGAAEPLLKRVAATAGSAAARVALSSYYLWRGRRDEAAATLQPMLGEPNTFPLAKTRLALIEFDRGAHAAADAHLADVLRREPAYAPALALRAHVLLQRGASADALAAARAAVAASPRSAQAHYALGRASVANGDTSQAREALLETIRVDPRATSAYAELSRLHLMEGQTALAIERGRQAVALDRGSLETRLTLARALMADPRRATEAAALLDGLAASHPDAVPVHLARGTLAMLQRNRTTARASFERALAIAPRSLPALSGVVTTALQAGELVEAQARLEAFARDGADGRPEALLLLAQVAMMQNAPARAERTLRALIEQHPDSFEAYSALGTLYVAQQRLGDARDEFVRVVRGHPRSVGVLTLVGILSESLSEPEEAARWYERALEVDPSAPVAANNLAWLYAEQGRDLARAVELAAGARAALPDRPEVIDTLGWAYYKADLIASAVPLFQRSIELRPRNPLYHYHLGLAYLAARDEPRARMALTRALTIDPSFAGAEGARAALATLP